MSDRIAYGCGAIAPAGDDMLLPDIDDDISEEAIIEDDIDDDDIDDDMAPLILCFIFGILDMELLDRLSDDIDLPLPMVD